MFLFGTHHEHLGFVGTDLLSFFTLPARSHLLLATTTAAASVAAAASPRASPAASSGAAWTPALAPINSIAAAALDDGNFLQPEPCTAEI